MMIVNIIIIVILLISIGSGYKQGFLWKLISLLGFFLVGILSWWLSSILSPMIHLYPSDQIPLAGTFLEGMLYNNLNRIVVFVLLFIVLEIILLVLKPMVKILGSLPVVSTLNKLCGAVLGFVQAILLMTLACLVLRLPFWENGNEIVNTSLLRYSEPICEQLITIAKEPISWVEESVNGLEDSKTLTNDERQQLKEWLLSQGIEEEKVTSFLKTLQ